jgi:hypothetical protein
MNSRALRCSTSTTIYTNKRRTEQKTKEEKRRIPKVEIGVRDNLVLM